MKKTNSSELIEPGHSSLVESQKAPSPPNLVSRRNFLKLITGALAGGVVVAATGSKSEKTFVSNAEGQKVRAELDQAYQEFTHAWQHTLGQDKDNPRSLLNLRDLHDRFQKYFAQLFQASNESAIPQTPRIQLSLSIADAPKQNYLHDVITVEAGKFQFQYNSPQKQEHIELLKRVLQPTEFETGVSYVAQEKYQTEATLSSTDWTYFLKMIKGNDISLPLEAGAHETLIDQLEAAQFSNCKAEGADLELRYSTTRISSENTRFGKPSSGSTISLAGGDRIYQNLEANLEAKVSCLIQEQGRSFPVTFTFSITIDSQTSKDEANLNKLEAGVSWTVHNQFDQRLRYGNDSLGDHPEVLKVFFLLLNKYKK